MCNSLKIRFLNFFQKWFFWVIAFFVFCKDLSMNFNSFKSSFLERSFPIGVDFCFGGGDFPRIIVMAFSFLFFFCIYILVFLDNNSTISLVSEGMSITMPTYMTRTFSWTRHVIAAWSLSPSYCFTTVGQAQRASY